MHWTCNLKCMYNSQVKTAPLSLTGVTCEWFFILSHGSHILNKDGKLGELAHSQDDEYSETNTRVNEEHNPQDAISDLSLFFMLYPSFTPILQVSPALAHAPQHSNTCWSLHHRLWCSTKYPDNTWPLHGHTGHLPFLHTDEATMKCYATWHV